MKGLRAPQPNRLVRHTGPTQSRKSSRAYITLPTRDYATSGDVSPRQIAFLLLELLLVDFATSVTLLEDIERCSLRSVVA